MLAYTSKGGWVCRLCSTDKLPNLDEHCKTYDHMRRHEELEARRKELEQLVNAQEQKLRHDMAMEEAKQEKQRQLTLKQQRLEKQQQERVQQQEENFPNQMDATERRAAVHPGISDRIRAEERRLRDREFERLYEEDKEPATQREQTARTLRAQRLAAAKRGSSPVETPAVVTPPTNSLKARQQAAKDEKRRKAEEITKKHMKQQKEEEQRVFREWKEADEKRQRDMSGWQCCSTNEMFDFWNDAFGISESTNSPQR